MVTADNAPAAVLTESEMSEEGETSVFHHLQRDSDNTECDLLFDMAGGMVMSPPRPRMNFFGEEALFLTPDMAGGMMMSPPRPRMNFSGEEAALFLSPNFHADMNYFSLPSSDSIGNFDPYRLWNFAYHSEVQELENSKGRMMRPTWKQQQQQPCIEEVDAVLGQTNQSLGIWAAAPEAEAKNMRGTVQQSCWGSHPQPQTSDDHSVNNVDEWFQLAGGMMPSSPTMNYSLLSEDSLSLGVNFEPYRFWLKGENSVGYELHNRVRIMNITVPWIAVDSESHKKFWLSVAVEPYTDVNLFWKCKYTTFSLKVPIKSGKHGLNKNQLFIHEGMIRVLCIVRPCLDCFQKRLGILPTVLFDLHEANFEMVSLERQHWNSLEGKLIDNLERFAAELEKSHAVRNLPAVLEALCRIMQINTPCEDHIPKSSATNEERNNVVELNNGIDAKGGNSSSQKTNTTSRWEKDHGITCQLLQQLLGKSRNNTAKTLKVSISTFKRACRDFGINRWPNRKGKRPNCSHNQKQHVQATIKKNKGIQPCHDLPPLQATNISQCNNTISVKVTYKNDTIRFPLSSSSSTMKYLEEQLETKFKISLENFSIKYQDEEDEWITLTCDLELLHGLDVLRSCGKTVIRMMVTPKFD